MFSSLPSYRAYSGREHIQEIDVLTPTLSSDHHSRVQESFNESLTNLGVDDVDLVGACLLLTVILLTPHFTKYLLHWPQCVDENDKAVSSPTFVEVWAEIEKIYEQKKAKAIGVSNFSIKK